MTEHRTHYLINDRGSKADYWSNVRCGNLQAKNTTIDPKRVTCGSCKRLMKGEVK